MLQYRVTTTYLLANLDNAKTLVISKGVQTICSIPNLKDCMGILRSSYLKQNIGDNVDIFL